MACSGPGKLVVAGLIQGSRDGAFGQRHVAGDWPSGTRTAATSLTPPRFFSSSVTARTQCSQVIPVTW